MTIEIGQNLMTCMQVIAVCVVVGYCLKKIFE
jgi:hypothetical protein